MQPAIVATLYTNKKNIYFSWANKSLCEPLFEIRN